MVTDQCRSVDPQVYVFDHSEQLQFHNCCSFSFILSILQFVLNIANLLHRPITETLDDHVCTRDRDAASVVSEWNVVPDINGILKVFENRVLRILSLLVLIERRMEKIAYT